jgi:probable rRNA maturation factor
MRIRVVDRQQRLDVSRSALRTIARRALAARESGYDEIGIALLDDSAMREVNRNFRDLDRTTDVLSFDLRSARVAGEPRAGAILISTDRVVVQARRYRVTAARELARLTIHGLLHLQGLDHRWAAERRRMRAAEREILSAVGPAVRDLAAACDARPAPGRVDDRTPERTPRNPAERTPGGRSTMRRTR